jgi:hypothetical protein
MPEIGRVEAHRAANLDARQAAFLGEGRDRAISNVEQPGGFAIVDQQRLD